MSDRPLESERDLGKTSYGLVARSVSSGHDSGGAGPLSHAAPPAAHLRPGTVWLESLPVPGQLWSDWTWEDPWR